MLEGEGVVGVNTEMMGVRYSFLYVILVVIKSLSLTRDFY